MRSFFAWIRDTLVGTPETPLNAVADPETVELVLSELARLKREIATLQYEWSETLDKLTVQAARFSARQRKRTQRELDSLSDDTPGEELAPPAPPAPLVPSIPLTKLQRIQQQIAARRAGGV